MLKLTKPDGSPITSYHHWTRPKKDYQWKAGRSAMELALSWFRNNNPQPPDELLALLHSSTRSNNLQFTSGIPELVTPLPERGEGRNHDLALIGNTSTEQVTVTIEAKADEPFGNDTILEYYNKAIKRRDSGKSTRVPERIEQLLAMVDPETSVQESKWKNIRYQLLTALCGTILQARIDVSSLAVLVIHEFWSDETSAYKHKQNHVELEYFLSVLAGSKKVLVTDKLYNGFIVDGMDLMIGKVITTLA
jgi:uncharacterized protein DUF6946